MYVQHGNLSSANSAFCLFHSSDLEKSVEEIQKDTSVNHKLVTVQELEEKTTVLRKLGETLTELKSESCWHISNNANTVFYSGRQFLSSSYSKSTCYLLVIHSKSVKHLASLRLFSVLPCTTVTCGVTHLLSPTDQFPGLQSKMRVVLRVEVEAVKFLKEEPHRLDALLKRCKTITDTLTTMRKYEPAPAESKATSVIQPFCAS